MAALLERISEAIMVYPRIKADADGSTGQRLAEGAPITLQGYLTPTDYGKETVEGQQLSNVARITVRTLGGQDPKALQNARYVWRGRTFQGTGMPEDFNALRATRHWKIHVIEVTS